MFLSHRMHFWQWLIKPLFELLAWAEDLRKQEIKQRPKFCQIILQRCACEQNSVRWHIRLAKRLCKFAFSVLHAMSFIHDNVLPLDFAKSWLVVEDILICCQHDIVLLVLKLCSNDWPLIPFSFIADHFDRGSPSLKLWDPIRNGSQRHYHEEWTFITFVSDQICEQRNGLDCFTKAHLICKDTIEVIVVQWH